MSSLRCVMKTSLIPFLILMMVTLGVAAEEKKAETKTSTVKNITAKNKTDKKKDPYAWRSLFDGKTLKGWKTPDFFSDGKVKVADGCIILGEGSGITGVAFAGKPPKTNYEIEFQAKRLKGEDFFGTVTVPVGKNHCSVVIGGWGGHLIGISSVDYFDASENSTTRDYELKSKIWYTIRVRTSDKRIEVWIDKKLVIDQLRAGHKFDVRFEVEDCCPLGFASWCTEAAIRKVRLRKLRPKEVKAAAKQREGEIED